MRGKPEAEQEEDLKPFYCRVSCMTASYKGKIFGTDVEDAKDRQKRAYRAQRDDRAGWTFYVRPWEKSDEDQDEEGKES